MSISRGEKRMEEENQLTNLTGSTTVKVRYIPPNADYGIPVPQEQPKKVIDFHKDQVEVPKKVDVCPFIFSCPHLLFFDDFKNTCLGSYQDCKFYKELSRSMKTPKEWYLTWKLWKAEAGGDK